METKEYIGHGTQHSEWNIIDVVLEVDKMMPHTFSYEGKRYLKVSVAARKERSKFGATHTVYLRPKAGPTVAAKPPAPKKKARKAKA